jgi:hypothetical protein
VGEGLETSDELETTAFLDAIVCSTNRTKYGRCTDEEPPSRNAVDYEPAERGVDVGTRYSLLLW